MRFNEEWTALENEFKEQVERDNSELSVQSSYLHNFTPSGPVDYVLIAMEPSTGVPVRKIHSRGSTQIDRNFTWSIEDFIFHYCIREYLCQNGETYHLTDLSKGQMTTRDASKRRSDRYDRWYPLLAKELKLLSKPEGTRIIAVGNVVAGFLKKKSLCECVEKVLHYTRTAAPHRDKVIECWREGFCKFIQSLDENAFEASIKEVLNDANMDSYIPYRPEGGRPYKLTESRKKLMFYYKNRFGELRDACHIVLSSRCQ